MTYIDTEFCYRTFRIKAVLKYKKSHKFNEGVEYKQFLNFRFNISTMDARIIAIMCITVPFLMLGIIINKCFPQFLKFCAYIRNNYNTYRNVPTTGEVKYGDQKSKAIMKETSVDQDEIVIALDIGTENMGYAFSCQTRKNRIYTAKNSSSSRNNRMPTVVLLNDDLSLNSAGFAAVNCRSELTLKKLHSKYLYFIKFRLKVFKEDGVDSDCQGTVSGEKIFCHIMEFLKRDALETTKQILFRDGGYTEDNIEWVLTTPSVITKEAETVILRAAKNAKLENIKLVPESDAAAWYCRHTHLMISQQNEITNMSKGHKFVVADLGAGKTSICVYEVLPDGTLDQKYNASENIGGNSVNEEFERFMEMICGPSSWNKFSINHVYDYEKLMYFFEEEKIKFDNNTDCIVLPLPETLKTIKSGSPEAIIESQGVLPDTAKLIEGKLFIYRKQIEKYYMPSLQLILNTLKRIREEFAEEDFDELLLVGGYSASAFIRKELKEKCPLFDIVLVLEPEMVVLKGAVLIGLENRPVLRERKRERERARER